MRGTKLLKELGPQHFKMLLHGSYQIKGEEKTGKNTSLNTGTQGLLKN